MPFNVQEFMANFAPGGMAKGYSYDMHVITGLPQLQMPDIEQNITFRCDSIEFPGRHVATSEYKIYGPVQRLAYDQIFTHVTATIILGEDFAEKIFFQRWQDMAVGTARGTMGHEHGIFDLGYYEDYIGTVDLNQYNAFGERVYTCTLLDAFPINIANLPVNWADDNLLRLAVTFDYHYFVDDVGFHQSLQPPADPDHTEEQF